jgi:hypothetical protein
MAILKIASEALFLQCEEGRNSLFGNAYLALHDGEAFTNANIPEFILKIEHKSAMARQECILRNPV